MSKYFYLIAIFLAVIFLKPGYSQNQTRLDSNELIGFINSSADKVLTPQLFQPVYYSFSPLVNKINEIRFWTFLKKRKELELRYWRKDFSRRTPINLVRKDDDYYLLKIEKNEALLYPWSDTNQVAIARAIETKQIPDAKLILSVMRMYDDPYLKLLEPMHFNNADFMLLVMNQVHQVIENNQGLDPFKIQDK